MDNRKASLPDSTTAPSEWATRALVIVNPATRKSSDTVVSLLRKLCPSDVELEIVVTPGPSTALELTRSLLAGRSVVVAVGGDGTVGEVASALVGTNIPLAIVPAGSTNIIAKELGIPDEPQGAVRLVFGAHRTRKVDVVQAGQRCFLHMAGAGIDSRMFALANPSVKRRFGWLAYIPAGGRALFHRPVKFTLEIDDDVLVVYAPLVLVANGGSVVTPKFKLMPRLRTDDGWLDVLIFKTPSAWAVTKTLGSILMRRLHQSPYVIHRSAKRVTLHSDPPLPVELDGDVAAITPIRFQLLAEALRVIVPLERGQELDQ